MFAHLLSTDSRRDAEPTGLSLICVQLKLVAIHPEQNITNTCLNTGQNIINTCLNTGQNRSEAIGCCTFGQLSVISVFVIVTVMDRNHIRQRLRVQSKQDWSWHETLGHAFKLVRVQLKNYNIDNTTCTMRCGETLALAIKTASWTLANLVSHANPDEDFTQVSNQQNDKTFKKNWHAM